MKAQTQGPAHDKPEQLQTVQEGLLQGEQVMAVFDGKGSGTGFPASRTGASSFRTIPSSGSGRRPRRSPTAG